MFLVNVFLFDVEHVPLIKLEPSYSAHAVVISSVCSLFTPTQCCLPLVTFLENFPIPTLRDLINARNIYDPIKTKTKLITQKQHV